MSDLRIVRDLLALSTAYLEERGCDNPRLDAEVLMGHVLKVDRLHLYLNLDRPLETEEVDKYRCLIGLRGRRNPVAYLTGTKEFYSNEYKVTEDVLVPRPETELLVDQAVARIKTLDLPQVLDLGTGSGIIGVSIALLVPQSQVLAVDISQPALDIARENADRLGVTDQLSFLQSDMFEKIPERKFHLICSNPPYIPSLDLEMVEKEVQLEPQIALDGGPDGLDFYRTLTSEAPQYLHKGGFLILEIGYDQGKAIADLATVHGFSNCQILQDYAGNDRVVIMRWD